MALLTRRYVVILFACALLLRLGLLFSFHGTERAEQADARDYSDIATNLLHGKGFTNLAGVPTQMRPPVFPLFVASVFAFTQYSWRSVKIVQCIISALSVVLIALLAALMFGAAPGRISGILAMLYPPFIIYSNILLSETMYIFLMLLCCLALFMAMKTLRLRYFLLFGIFHGISVLCRSTVILLPFFLVVFFLLSEHRARLMKGFALFLVTSSLIIVPWTIRNYIVFHTFLPVNVGSGHVLWLTTVNSLSNGDRIVEPDIEVAYPAFRAMPRHEWEKLLVREVFKSALRNPLQYAGKLAENVVRFWTLPVGKVLLAERSAGAARLYQYAHYLFLGLTFFGVYACRNRLAAALPVVIYSIYFVLIHIPFLALPRYRMPVEAFMLMFVAAALVQLRRRIMGSNNPGIG